MRVETYTTHNLFLHFPSGPYLFSLRDREILSGGDCEGERDREQEGRERDGEGKVWCVAVVVRLCVREKDQKIGKGGLKIVSVRLCERERQREREHESRFGQKSNKTQKQRLGRYRIKECERHKKQQRIVREIEKV